MPRWEVGSEERLKKAAMELFEEKGFEKTSVDEIAERASVTTRTFFRYFPDKREVLFSESDGLRAALVAKIKQSPHANEPLQLVSRILAEFDWETMGSRDFQRKRQALIAANPELLERDLIKLHSIAVGFSDALRRRGIKTPIAQLAGRVGVQVFLVAYERWLEVGHKADLASTGESMMSHLSRMIPRSL